MRYSDHLTTPGVVVTLPVFFMIPMYAAGTVSSFPSGYLFILK